MSKFASLTAGLMAAGALLAAGTPASAAGSVGAGTVSVGANYVPTVNLSTAPKTYTANFGNTFETSGDGAFTNVTGLSGKMNGTLQFDSTPGSTIDQTLANFFVFDDGEGGTYNFSVSSVTDINYTVKPGVSSAIDLYLLGTTVDAFKGLTAPTPTSITLSFNNTGKSKYSASATLDVPPISAAPEPSAWALMIAGIGMLGISMRRRASQSGSLRGDRMVAAA